MNNNKKQKITLFGAILLFIAATYTPNIRYVSKIVIKYAHQAAWLVPVAALVLYIPLCYLIYRLSKAFENKSLHDMFCQVFGKAVGKALSVVLLLWSMVLLGLYIKYTGEKLVSSVYVGTDINLLTFLLVILVGFILRWGIKVMVRLNKFIYIIGVLHYFLINVAVLIINFSVENITPVSTLDIDPVLTSVPYAMTICVYMTCLLVFNDQIEYNKKRAGIFSFAVGFHTFAHVFILLAILGMFGYELANKTSYPFLMAVENLQFGNGSAGLESLFISALMLYEFVIVSFMTYVIVRLIRDIFGLTREVPVLTAVLGFGYFFSIFLCNNVFELVEFSEYVATPANLILWFGLPLLLFATAKIRKML